jgi:hypothetical protein
VVAVSALSLNPLSRHPMPSDSSKLAFEDATEVEIVAALSGCDQLTRVWPPTSMVGPGAGVPPSHGGGAKTCYVTVPGRPTP